MFRQRLCLILTLGLVLVGLTFIFARVAAAQGPVIWQPAAAPPGAYVSAFAVHPTNPNRLWAATLGDYYGDYAYLYRSEDGGESWQRVGSNLPTRRTVTALAVNPVTPTILYAGLDGNYYAGIGDAQLVWRSDDGGNTWIGAYAGLPITGSVRSLLVDPAQPQTIYVTLGDTDYAQAPPAFLYRSLDGGRSWQRADSGLPGYVYDLAARPDGQAIYVGSQHGVYLSRNHGVSWTPIGPDIADYVPGYNSGYSVVHALIVSGTMLYANVLGVQGSGHNEQIVGSNIYYTSDNGTTWHTGTGFPDNVQGTALVLADNDLYASWIRSYWVGGARREEVGGVRSADGGQTWMPITMPGCARRFWGPSADNDLFVSIKYGGLMRSTDKSQSWAGSSQGLEAGSVYITALAAYSDTVYAGSFWGVLFKSTDRGMHWNVLAPGLGMCDVQVKQIAIYPTDARRVFVGTAPAGLFRSTDGGDTWVKLLDGNVEQITLLPNAPEKVWVAMEYGGLQYSGNGGDSWQTVESRYLPVYSVAVHPRNPNVVLAGTTGIWLGDRYYCVFRTSNGGATWSPVLGGTPACSPGHATLVEWNLADPNIAYADGYRSQDSGQTWDIPRGAPWHLVFNPNDPRTVYGLTMDLVFGGQLQRSLDGGQTWITQTWPAGGIDRFAVGWSGGVPRLYALETDAPMRFWWALDDNTYRIYLPLISRSR